LAMRNKSINYKIKNGILKLMATCIVFEWELAYMQLGFE